MFILEIGYILDYKIIEVKNVINIELYISCGIYSIIICKI